MTMTTDCPDDGDDRGPRFATATMGRRHLAAAPSSSTTSTPTKANKLRFLLGGKCDDGDRGVNDDGTAGGTSSAREGGRGRGGERGGGRGLGPTLTLYYNPPFWE